jgi:hypothetical protein
MGEGEGKQQGGPEERCHGGSNRCGRGEGEREREEGVERQNLMEGSREGEWQH